MANSSNNAKTDHNNGAGDPSGLPAGRPAANEEHMAIPVTRHVQITDGPREWKFLTGGIDSLDLGFYVDWGAHWPELQEQLENKRTEAAGTKGVLWKETPCGGCLVWPSGKQPMYRYHIELPDAHIFIQARERWKNSPNVYVSLSARSLWTLGVRDSVAVFTQVLRELGASIDRIQVSRVDLAMDFLMPGGLPFEFVRDTLVSRSEIRTLHLQNNIAETIYIGGASALIQARLYNKSVEVLERSEKLWFAQIWKTEAMEDIWRIEFQIRRKALKQYGINSVTELLEKSGGLWADLTSSWMSLRLDDSSNTSRRSVHLWWQAVHDSADTFGQLVEVKRKLAAWTSADVEWYVSHIAGCIAGFAARSNVPEIAAALLALRQKIIDYWKERDWDAEIEARRIRLGLETAEGGIDQ